LNSSCESTTDQLPPPRGKERTGALPLLLPLLLPEELLPAPLPELLEGVLDSKVRTGFEELREGLSLLLYPPLGRLFSVLMYPPDERLGVEEEFPKVRTPFLTGALLLFLLYSRFPVLLPEFPP
jgi:hypothetical protein